MRERRVHIEMQAAWFGILHAPGGADVEKRVERSGYLGHTVFMRGRETTDKFNVKKAFGPGSQIGLNPCETEKGQTLH